jgi:hypothetical protein
MFYSQMHERPRQSAMWTVFTSHFKIRSADVKLWAQGDTKPLLNHEP